MDNVDQLIVRTCKSNLSEDRMVNRIRRILGKYWNLDIASCLDGYYDCGVFNKLWEVSKTCGTNIKLNLFFESIANDIKLDYLRSYTPTFEFRGLKALIYEIRYIESDKLPKDYKPSLSYRNFLKKSNYE